MNNRQTTKTQGLLPRPPLHPHLRRNMDPLPIARILDLLRTIVSPIKQYTLLGIIITHPVPLCHCAHHRCRQGAVIIDPLPVLVSPAAAAPAHIAG